MQSSIKCEHSPEPKRHCTSPQHYHPVRSICHISCPAYQQVTSRSSNTREQRRWSWLSLVVLWVGEWPVRAVSVGDTGEAGERQFIHPVQCRKVRKWWKPVRYTWHISHLSVNTIAYQQGRALGTPLSASHAPGGASHGQSQTHFAAAGTSKGVEGSALVWAHLRWVLR